MIQHCSAIITVARKRAGCRKFKRVDVEDILVNGPPWNTRIWVRATDVAKDAAGAVAYENRVVACMDVRWGRIHRWEDYLDTERVAAWDRAQSALGAA